MSHAKFGKTVAEFVKKFREENGIEQKELAKLLKVSPQYIWNIEHTYNSKFPMAFCARLLPHLDSARRRYLTDLIMDMSLEAVTQRIGVDDVLKRKRSENLKRRIKPKSRSKPKPKA